MPNNSRHTYRKYFIPTMIILIPLVLFITQVSRHPFIPKDEDEMMNIKEKKDLGNKYFQNKDYSSALKEYEDGIEIIKKQLALDFYELDLEVAGRNQKKMNDELAIFNYNIALIYYNKKDYYKTIDKLKESMVTVKLNHARNKMAVCYFKIGNFYAAHELASSISIQTMELKRILYDIENNIFTRSFVCIDTVKITKDYCLDVLSSFLNKKQISEEQLKNILRVGYNLHLNLDNVQYIESEDAIVFGDTHGQFLDTCNILNMIGNTFNFENFLLDTKTYIFNGDFVDRGLDGIENFIFLVSLKILYPQQVFLNRGNHEYESTNRYFGFFDEIKRKYKNTDEIFKMFQLVFTTLPLCSVLNNKYFIVHGGLPEKIPKIDEIQEVNRFSKFSEDILINGLMWSDPGEIKRLEMSKRGAGVMFGYEMTDEFLRINQFECIIRSHEYITGGIKYNHGNKVITIFSAPNYCNIEGDAAVLSIKDAKFDVIKVKNWEYYIKSNDRD